MRAEIARLNGLGDPESAQNRLQREADRAKTHAEGPLKGTAFGNPAEHSQKEKIITGIGSAFGAVTLGVGAKVLLGQAPGIGVGIAFGQASLRGAVEINREGGLAGVMGKEAWKWREWASKPENKDKHWLKKTGYWLKSVGGFLGYGVETFVGQEAVRMASSVAERVTGGTQTRKNLVEVVEKFTNLGITDDPELNKVIISGKIEELAKNQNKSQAEIATEMARMLGREKEIGYFKLTGLMRREIHQKDIIDAGKSEIAKGLDKLQDFLVEQSRDEIASLIVEGKTPEADRLIQRLSEAKRSGLNMKLLEGTYAAGRGFTAALKAFALLGIVEHFSSSTVSAQAPEVKPHGAVTGDDWWARHRDLNPKIGSPTSPTTTEFKFSVKDWIGSADHNVRGDTMGHFFPEFAKQAGHPHLLDNTSMWSNKPDVLDTWKEFGQNMLGPGNQADHQAFFNHVYEIAKAHNDTKSLEMLKDINYDPLHHTFDNTKVVMMGGDHWRQWLSHVRPGDYKVFIKK